MDLSVAYLSASLLLAVPCLVLQGFLRSRDRRDALAREWQLVDRQEHLISEIAKLEQEIANLEARPVPKAKETLTVEAQQILHDLTAHGEAIVRITPLSPTDIFWRSPR